MLHKLIWLIILGTRTAGHKEHTETENLGSNGDNGNGEEGEKGKEKKPTDEGGAGSGEEEPRLESPWKPRVNVDLLHVTLAFSLSTTRNSNNLLYFACIISFRLMLH